MTTRLHRLALAGALVAIAALVAAGGNAGSSAPGDASPDTRRILDTIAREAPRRTDADRHAAEALAQQGDEAYRRGDYRAAASAYADAYPNFPTARAYILAGDARWRDALQFALDTPARPAAAASGAPLCAIGNQHFPHDLLQDVAQHQEVGLALAARAGGGQAPVDPFLKRARESATCLEGLAHRYEHLAPATCVDLAALQACLGTPLIQ
jgi:hypothetical protein